MRFWGEGSEEGGVVKWGGVTGIGIHRSVIRSGDANVGMGRGQAVHWDWGGRGQNGNDADLSVEFCEIARRVIYWCVNESSAFTDKPQIEQHTFERRKDKLS